MADFFKGLAGGFGTGLQFGQAMQQRQERERLREAIGLTPQEMQQRQATPEELGRAQAETQGIAAQDAAMFGLGPQEQAAYAPQMPVEGQRIGATQYGLGGQTFNRMPTQQEIESARYAAAANVIAERDPVAAMRMRQEQVRMQREAELAPLQKEALQTQVSAGRLGLKKTALELTDAERVAAERENFSGFNAFAAENPNLSVKELKDTAFKQFKFTPKQWQDTVATRLQIETGEMDSFKNNVKKKLQGKNLTQLGSLYNSDPDFDDKTDLAIVPGKGGAVTLNFIDKATKAITGTQTFKNEALATEYLNRQATEPETIGSWIMNLRKGEAAIAASEASAAKDNSLAGRYARDEGEKGLTKKVADVEASLGRKLTEPEKMTLFGLTSRPRDEKPTKVEEAGVQYKVDGKLVQTDGMGGFMSVKGILPEARPAALKAAGVSDNNLGRLIWSNDGEAVMFNNEEFDVRDKRDMAKLNKSLADYDVMNRKIAEEARLRANPTSPSGFQGARTTGIGPASSYGVAPGAQSIYGR